MLLLVLPAPPSGAAVVSGLPAGMAAPYPSVGARIVAFTGAQPPGLDDPSGPLVLRYSDGTVMTIPNESGDFNTDGAVPGKAPAGDVLPQVSFDEVALAPDHRTIGWLASYMLCAQSYPCDVELVLFHFGRKTVVIRPESGVAVGWMFEHGGALVALFSALPHGDDEGVCRLYDTVSGRLIATYKAGGQRPGWVRDVAGDEGCH